MIKYGIELELFQTDENNKIIIPESTLPLDGSGVMVELRSSPNTDLYNVVSEIKKEIRKLTDSNITFSNNIIHKFNRDEERQGLKQSNKNFNVEIYNVYNRKRKLLPRFVYKTSCQINLSNLITEEYKRNDVTIPAQYGLLPVEQIVKALDKEFFKEIKDADRSPGEYAIKDGIRLEYRSLPSSIINDEQLEKRILNVINNFNKKVL